MLVFALHNHYRPFCFSCRVDSDSDSDSFIWSNNNIYIHCILKNSIAMIRRHPLKPEAAIVEATLVVSGQWRDFRVCRRVTRRVHNRPCDKFLKCYIFVARRAGCRAGFRVTQSLSDILFWLSRWCVDAIFALVVASLVACIIALPFALVCFAVNLYKNMSDHCWSCCWSQSRICPANTNHCPNSVSMPLKHLRC